MRNYPSASALIGATKPDVPVMGVRPHAAGRAARWFIDNFPGDVAYAYKANSSVFLLGALYVLVNTAVDVLQMIADPSIRR